MILKHSNRNKYKLNSQHPPSSVKSPSMTSSKNSSISAWISCFVSMMCLKNLEWFRGHIPVQKQNVPVTSTIPCLLCCAHWHQQEHQGYIKMLTVMCCIVTKTRGSKNLITKIYFKKFKWQEEAFFIWLSGNSLSSGLTYQFAMPHNQDWPISLPYHTIRTDLPVCHATQSGLSVCQTTQSGLTYQSAMLHNQDWPISLPCRTKQRNSWLVLMSVHWRRTSSCFTTTSLVPSSWSSQCRNLVTHIRGNKHTWLYTSHTSTLVMASYGQHAADLPASDLAPFFQRRPGSNSAKPAQIWSGWPGQVWGKHMWSGGKLVCKNHWARFQQNATSPLTVSHF